MKGFIAFIPLIIFALNSAWEFSGSTSRQLGGELVNRVETEEKVIALTFDDGPTPGFTKRVLDILEAEDVRATFFLVGESIEANPLEAERIIEAGHEVGNHSYSHPRMVLVDYEFVAGELERTDELIREAGFTGTIHFRPPFGRKLFSLPRYLDDHGITSITWDVAPETWDDEVQPRAEVVEKVLQEARPGSIVLLHVMFPSRENTIAAVPEVIRGLRQQGYRFVTVSEMLKYRQPG